jgi:hypothetical protein
LFNSNLGFYLTFFGKINSKVSKSKHIIYGAKNRIEDDSDSIFGRMLPFWLMLHKFLSKIIIESKGKNGRIVFFSILKKFVSKCLFLSRV